MIERVWIIAAGILLVIAAGFLWRNNLSAAFVIATLGACAWFLGYRAQLRSKTKQPEDSDADDSEYNDED